MVKKCALGVDVGTASIKALVGMINGRDNISIIGSGFVPTVGFSKGMLTDAARLAKAIKEAVDCAVMAAETKVEDIYLGIGGLGIVSGNSRGSVALSPKSIITGADIKRVCQVATMLAVPEDYRILHTLPIRYWVDGNQCAEEPVGQQGVRLEVDAHVVSVPEAVIAEISEELAALGIHLSGIMANAVTGLYIEGGTEETSAVIDIGAGLSDLALLHRGKICVSSSLIIGGDYVTNDIMQALGISRPHAEEVKRYYAKLNGELRGKDIMLDCNGYGTTDIKVAYDFLAKVIESRIEEIIYIVHQYFQPEITRYGVKKIVLTGGSVLSPSFAMYIEKFFNIKPELIALGNRLPAEYAQQSNTACYGILNEVAMGVVVDDDNEVGMLRLLVNKIKNLI
ncbi:MAG: cell division protein FtsA [Firmicutes bacterium]|nr:cell division protein FtsA [Bacillota bacterium]